MLVPLQYEILGSLSELDFAVWQCASSVDTSFNPIKVVFTVNSISIAKIQFGALALPWTACHWSPRYGCQNECRQRSLVLGWMRLGLEDWDCNIIYLTPSIPIYVRYTAATPTSGWCHCACPLDSRG